MKTASALILAFLIIAIGFYLFNKRPSKNSILANRAENNKSASDSGVGAGISSDGVSINGDNHKNINMKLISPAFENNQYIPSQYTCDGADINPPFSIVEAPESAESLVLIVDDPDAPSGDWVHWTIFNISPDTKEIKEGAVPAGSIEGRTDFRNNGYGGPCPHSGIHHYQFKLYALDAALNLDAGAGKKEIEKAMSGRTLAQDLLVGLYKRK